MKLQDQVCTLDQAKRLRELGVSQCAEFKLQYLTVEPNKVHRIWQSGPNVPGWRPDSETVAAFTVAELGVMLKGRTMPIWWDLWEGFCYKEGSQPRGYGTEAQARAAMLIYLLENKYITAEEVNKRLQQ